MIVWLGACMQVKDKEAQNKRKHDIVLTYYYYTYMDVVMNWTQAIHLHSPYQGVNLRQSLWAWTEVGFVTTSIILVAISKKCLLKAWGPLCWKGMGRTLHTSISIIIIISESHHNNIICYRSNGKLNCSINWTQLYILQPDINILVSISMHSSLAYMYQSLRIWCSLPIMLLCALHCWYPIVSWIMNLTSCMYISIHVYMLIILSLRYVNP